MDWTYKIDDKYIYVYPKGTYHLTGWIAKVDYDDVDPDEAEDIAKVIVAAPSMIQIIKLAKEALKPFADCCEYINSNESDEEWAKFRLIISDYRRAKVTLDLLESILLNIPE